MMLSEGNFLLLDEPTNHLDLLSKEILEDAINGYTGTILYISHDRYFINKTASKILELSPLGVTEYLGNYDYYLEKRNEINLAINSSNLKDEKASSAKDEWLRQKEEQAQQRKLQAQIESIEKEIHEIESQIEEIDELLCLEEDYTNPEKSKEAYDSKVNLEAKLESLYQQWEELHP